MVNMLIANQNLLRKRHSLVLTHTLMYLQIRDNDKNYDDYIEATHFIEQGVEEMKELEKSFEEFDKTVLPTLTTEQKAKLLPYSPCEDEMW